MRLSHSILFLSLMFIAVGVRAEENKTLTALGLPQDSRVLIIHADDVGMSWAVEDGSIQAMEKGWVTTGSAMVPCSWFPATVKHCKENPDLDMGLHLTLTSEWSVYRWGPVAGRSVVPGLLDDEGYLWRNVMQVYQGVGGATDQIEQELQAQIDLARKQGLVPTHIDSHMGTLYYNGSYFKVVCNLALKNDIPFMVFKYRPELQGVHPALGYYTQEVADTLEAAGFPLLDMLIQEEQVGDTYEEGFANYSKVISELPVGVTLMILHLGIDSPEFKHITGRHWARDQQYRIFTDPKMKEHLEKENITLIGWRELKEAIWDKRDKSIKKVF
ncbi:MAG: polysaccharide deacetylase family protein [Candidatus Omnitrophica bacterium]|nr:polysaccharide deacetylase family protein [Candidatus Omnitrophota bacterium]